MSQQLGDFDAQKTYSDAATEYDRVSVRYWPFAARTVERLALRPGMSVLDIACGNGAGAIAAARAVGPDGRVVGVDYADGMLQVARARAAADGVTNVAFEQGDMLALRYGPVFDVVMCSLGIFFVEDMPAAVARQWACVRPGGRLAITTAGTGFLAPWIDEFLAEAKRLRPDVEVIAPWRRAEDPALLRTVIEAACVPGTTIETESADIPCTPDDWWDVVMASGLRAGALALGDDAPRVREANTAWAQANGITTIRSTANYAVATKRA